MNTPLHEMGRRLARVESAVWRLNETNRELIEVMEEQIDAVIAADPDEVERLTEKQIVLSGRSRREQQAFVEGLEEVISELGEGPAGRNRSGEKLPDDLKPGGREGDPSSKPIRLGTVGEMLPEQRDKILLWSRSLEDSTLRLRQKQEQASRLLEFAQARNAGLMHAVYRAGGREELHYNRSGDASGLSSGVAVNQEV